MEMLRPMDVGELLDRAFFTYRNNFLVFNGIAAIPYFSLLLFRLALVNQLQRASLLHSLVFALITGLFSMLVFAIAQSGTAAAVSNVHLGRPASIASSYASLKDCWRLVLGGSILTSIGIGFGILLMIVPGILFGLAWSLTVPIIVIEKRSILDAMSRSWELTRGGRLRTLAILVIVYIISAIVSVMIQAPVLFIAGLWAIRHQAVVPLWITVLTYFFNFIATTLVMPVAIIATSLIYYDQRVRKEGFDLQMMLDSLESSPENGQPGMN